MNKRGKPGSGEHHFLFVKLKVLLKYLKGDVLDGQSGDKDSQFKLTSEDNSRWFSRRLRKCTGAESSSQPTAPCAGEARPRTETGRVPSMRHIPAQVEVVRGHMCFLPQAFEWYRQSCVWHTWPCYIHFC